MGLAETVFLHDFEKLFILNLHLICQTRIDLLLAVEFFQKVVLLEQQSFLHIINLVDPGFEFNPDPRLGMDCLHNLVLLPSQNPVLHVQILDLLPQIIRLLLHLQVLLIDYILQVVVFLLKLLQLLLQILNLSQFHILQILSHRMELRNLDVLNQQNIVLPNIIQHEMPIRGLRSRFVENLV